MNDLILDSPGRRMLLDVPFHDNDNALTPFRHALGAVWSNRVLAGITAVVIFALVVGGGILMKRSHYAEAMLQIQSGHDNLEQVNQQNMQGVPPDTSAIDTEVEILRSPAIAEAVVKQLKLLDDPEFGAAARPGLLRRTVGALIGGAAPQPLPQSEVMRRTVAAVMGHSRIRRIGLTYMVQVGFVASTTQKAETIANAIVAAYLQSKLD
ncbi:MAG: Wzz/FepE/Etk N-terminal domain-containing protein, partial [Bryobacteraceae bacterium]